MPDAFRVASLRSPESPKSSWFRSSPLVFFCADLAFLGADLPGVFFSSSASSASLSAFLRAASAFLAASSSLFAEGGHSQHRTATSETARRDGGMGIMGWVVHSNTWMVPSWSSGRWWGLEGKPGPRVWSDVTCLLRQRPTGRWSGGVGPQEETGMGGTGRAPF